MSEATASTSVSSPPPAGNESNPQQQQQHHVSFGTFIPHTELSIDPPSSTPIGAPLSSPSTSTTVASSTGTGLDSVTSPAAGAFDPARSGTPHTTANSPLNMQMSKEDRSQSNASDIATPAPQIARLPILSMPALPGQKVCPCMRAVEESSGSPMQPTTSVSTPHSSSSSTSPAINSPSPPTASAASLDRFLSLQDRFWLNVGEVALFNEDHLVERGVDSMETLAVKLSHMSMQLTHTMSFLRDEQLRGVESLMSDLELKNSELVEFLKKTRGEEMIVRERIDALSIKVEKAKKTVQMGQSLSLATVKMQREQQHLDSVRAIRDEAQRHLENIVTSRTLAQNQMLNVSTIAAECRIQDMDKRDYKLMYKQVQSNFFYRSFGKQYQSQVDTMVKVLSKLRDQSHECARRKKFIEHTIHELRGRISMVVSAYWK